MTMKFSLYLNAQTRGPHEDVQIIETLMHQAVRATEAGFAGITLTEHHFSGYNTYGDNFMLAAHLVPQVPRETMFSMAVAVPTLHNPLRLAQKCNLIDILTRGRVIVGFAPGGSPVEYAGLGRDPSTRHEAMMRNLEILERALAKTLEDPPLAWETEFERGLLHTRIMPSGFHRAHPPFARATQSLEGAQWTGRRGWYFFTARETPEVLETWWKAYEAALYEGGCDETTVAERLRWSMVQKQVYVAESDQQAEREIRERLTLMAENQKRSFNLVSGLRDANHLKSVVGVSPQNPDEFLERAMIIGSPESVAEQLRQYHAVGVEHMALLFNYGFMTPAVSDRSLSLFIDEVLPRVGVSSMAQAH
ncbi:luciferase [Mycolicibacterium murale]|uniref:Luciferase n=1 Tax=Mycolicibacterium murale TaxID=182220 RepID=A0A7I9WXU6_9MYCO|nr:LLM class flavin-dependent oxidoreductase [Mycolicibacterium murale]MCV7181055.1 LLM class flavin-dependent oxidoreductase [Mycolicibacterium murale]GFG62026.1 luciferase [Mycolicibacterium murale]